MKQGNAIDLLGQDDPRAKDIGIIYVSPTDDRRSVLAAILTQEKLHRKQIAVVLPTQNKAFQRPADFDDLKNVRRKLQAQIVFIAPGGPGPAEFARHRRFPVYSSLEYYARALRDEATAPGTAPTPPADSGRKKGGLFGGRGAASKEPAPAPVPPAGKSGKDVPVMAPLPLASARTVTPAASQVPTPPGVQPAGDVEDMPTVPIAAPLTPFDADDELDFRPPASGPSTMSPPARPPATPSGPIVRSGTASTYGSQGSADRIAATPTNGGAGPEPLILGQGTRKPRRTVELEKASTPAPVVVPSILPEPDPEEDAPPKRSGKTAPIIAAAATGAALAADAAASGATGTEVAPWRTTPAPPPGTASSASVTPTPIRTVPPVVPPRQGARGTTGRGGRGNGRRRAGRGLLLVLLILFSILLLCGGMAFAAPYFHIPIPFITAASSPTYTVSVTPDVQQITNTYALSAITGTPNTTSLQVQARVLTSDMQSTAQTVNATGQGHTDPTYAHGFLTFYNSNTTPLTIARTVITASNGVQVENDISVALPAGDVALPSSKTVAATAIQPGVSGNITAQLIDRTCCVNGIGVKNQSAFTGGVDSKNFSIVQQSDIDGVINSVTPGLVTQAQAALSAKLGKSERYAENGTCTPTDSADQNAGAKASTVTVQVAVHCTREVYDTSQIAAVVTGQMAKTVQNTTGTHFSSYNLLDGQGKTTTLATVLSVAQTGFDPQTGTVSLGVQASGTWVYVFSTAEQQHIKSLIAGKTVAQAITILQGQPGIVKVSIQPTTGNLPTDTGQITITPMSVRGVSGPGGGAGSGGGAASGTPVTTSPTVGPLPTGTGVGMG